MTTGGSNGDRESEESDTDQERGYVRINRRDVMKAAGTSAVLSGYMGVGAAQEDEESCGCQELTADDSQCFDDSAAEDCFYCKIDPIPENGESCTIDGTSIEITVVEDSHCIDVSDPRGEVGAVALKSGSFCPCTIHEDVEDGDRLCTLNDEGDRCRNAISHITVEVCPQRITTSGEVLNCTEASIDVDNVETITLEVEFHECDTLTRTFTDGDSNNAISASIDLTAQARCYCTPTEMNVYEGDSTASEDLITTVVSDLPEGFCEPTLDATGDCASVTATATFPSAMPEAEQDELISGCPITATLHTDCDEMVEKTFETGDRVDSTTFELTWTAGTDYSCYCSPTQVTYSNDHGGATLSDQNDSFMLDCEPDATVDATCSSVDVSVSNGVEGCPIDATLRFSDCTDITQTLDAGNSFSYTFEVPCYCTPEDVLLEWDLLDGTQSITADATASDAPCEADVDATFACDEVSVSGTSVPGCDVEVKLFTDCDGDGTGEETVTKTFTAASDGTVSGSFDMEELGLCYCTPTKVEIYEVLPDGSTNLVETETQESGLDCTPTFDADFDCDTVSVEATGGLIDGCPVTATLYFEGDCADPRTATIRSGSPTAEFDITDLCECVPDRVVFTDADSGRELDTIDAPDLTCACEEFTDVCRIDEGQIEDLCNGNDVTVECGDAGQITFEAADVECSGNEVICFNFTSTFEVFRVFVKGGGGPDAGNEYIWSCGTFDSDDPEPDEINFETDDQTYNGKLCANKNPNNNKQTAVSHIDFSVCAEDLD